MNKYFYYLVLVLLIKENFGEKENRKLSEICDYEDDVIDCKSKKLESCFDQSEWESLNTRNFREAYFDSNSIGHLTSFPLLPNLTLLSFKSNRLVKIDDAAFFNLSSLQDLDLSDNQLTTAVLKPTIFKGRFLPGYLEPLINVVSIDLSDNELHSLHMDLFAHVPNLKRLNLQRNPFTVLDQNTVIAISSLPYLEVLDLSYTHISKLPETFLHTPKYLRELNLKGNNFTEIPVSVLNESHNLTILNLNDNPIKAITKESGLLYLPSLKELHISYMPKLTRIEDESLSGLTNLEYLDCKMNEKLGYISAKALSRNESERTIWPKLSAVDLGDNALRYLDFDFLGPGWANLKHLNLVGNEWSCDCENQWLLSVAIPLLASGKGPFKTLVCGAPEEMKGRQLWTLYKRNYTMRCLDYYGNHPEKDGTILVSIFIVITLLLVIIALIVWKRNTGCSFRQGGPVNYSRAFYRPAEMDEPDKF